MAPNLTQATDYQLAEAHTKAVSSAQRLATISVVLGAGMLIAALFVTWKLAVIAVILAPIVLVRIGFIAYAGSLIDDEQKRRQRAAGR